MQLLETHSSTSIEMIIRSGDVIEQGDRIQVALSDGTTRKGRVTGIDEKYLVVDDEQVPITAVVGVRTRKFSAGKTAALVGGATAYYLIVVSAGTAAIAALFGQ